MEILLIDNNRYWSYQCLKPNYKRVLRNWMIKRKHVPEKVCKQKGIDYKGRARVENGESKNVVMRKICGAKLFSLVFNLFTVRP